MARAKYPNEKEVFGYVNGIIDGSIIANADRVKACKRFLRDLENPAYTFNTKHAETAISIIEKTMVHVKGDRFVGKPFLLLSWEKFVVYNIFGFFLKGTKERRFKEAFIFIPRKNGKTPFAAALALVLELLNREGNPSLFIVGNVVKQALESFNVIKKNVKRWQDDDFIIKDSQNEHSIAKTFYDEDENECGSIHIEAVSNEPNKDNLDGKNAPYAIADEIHTYTSDNQYHAVKQMTKAYVDKLVIGITTAGRRANCFCNHHLKYCQRVLDEIVIDEQIFIFICMADDPADYTNPVEHEKANPSYGVIIRPQDILAESLQAQEKPESRDQFLNKSLNIFTNQLNTYFSIAEVQESDSNYSWTLEELAKLPIRWYGGADLSKMHDLTAGAIVGEYKDVLIVISHGFMPLAEASIKANEDDIPLFYWQDLDLLTLSNSEIVEFDDVAKWFIKMRGMGFKIDSIGYDRRFAREFVDIMKRHKFKMVDQDQKYWKKTEGFRYQERKIKSKKFYYMNSPAYLYCISNVKAIEDSEDQVKYMKVGETDRIDLFDGGIIGVLRMIYSREKSKMMNEIFK